MAACGSPTPAARFVPSHLAIAGGELRITVADAGAAYPLTIDPYVAPSTTPVATFNGPSNAGLGASVALSADGQTALVGASAFNSSTGAAYLFTATGGTWATAPVATFTGSANGSLFGTSVSLSGDGQTALIGAPNADQGTGAAYLYTAASGWSSTPVATFTGVPNATGLPSAQFGSSVSLSGDGQSALVGAPGAGASGAQGAAYLYSASSAWSNTPTATFEVTGYGPQENFGASVVLSADGQTALMGAPDASPTADSFDGAAFLFIATSGIWPPAPSATFAPAPGSGIGLGWSAALSGDGQTALVGSYNGNLANLYTAASGRSNTPTASFSVPDTGLGQSVTLSGDGQTALIGAPTGAHGQAYLYTASSGWSQNPVATYTDSAQFDRFGYSVALSGDGETALVGAIGGDAAYIYAGQTPTTTAVSASVNPAHVGQAVTYTATVTGPSGTLPASDDTVTFTNEGSPIPGCGAVDLSTTAPYTATCPVTYPATAGSPHAVVAAFNGDPQNAPSSSAPLSEQVKTASTTTMITSTTTSPVASQPITVSVQVSGQYPGSGVTPPSGAVTVTDGTRTCQATLSGSNGAAAGSCQLTEPSPGSYTFTGSYPGDTNFKASKSWAAHVKVTKAASSTALTLSAVSVVYGSETSLTMTVTVAPQFTGIPTGTVTITSGTTTVCTTTLSGGTGSCSPASPTALSPGNRTLTAHYPGDTDFRPSAASHVLRVT